MWRISLLYSYVRYLQLTSREKQPVYKEFTQSRNFSLANPILVCVDRSVQMNFSSKKESKTLSMKALSVELV